MTASVRKPENDLCRCCLAEGSSFLSITEPVYNLGTTEVFMDLLKSCLDIEIVPVMDVSTAMKICDPCVSRLRDANSFRKQVLKCEERFKEMYKELIKSLQPDVRVKEERTFEDEVKMEFPVDSDGEDDAGGFDDMHFDDSDDDQPIIKIKVEERSKATAAPPGPAKAKAKPAKAAKTAKKARKPAKVEDPPSGEGGSMLHDALTAEQRKKGRNATFHLKPTDYSQDGGAYICKLCEKRYGKFYSLRHHVRTKHYSKPKYVCPYCEKEFKTPAPLTIHKLEDHNVDDRFKCKACIAVFNTSVQLRKHVNNFHMLGEKYRCQQCDYESFSFESLYKHKFKHKTVKDYHCRFCKKAFLRKATLDLHERIHTGDRRKVCKVCGQAFVQKASLNYHMVKYHPEVNF